MKRRKNLENYVIKIIFIMDQFEEVPRTDIILLQLSEQFVGMSHLLHNSPPVAEKKKILTDTENCRLTNN